MEATSAPRPHGLRLPKPRRVLSALSDAKLVDHVRRGDAAAFEILYDRHSAGVLAFCRHMLGSAHDAEDAVQQAFIAAHADLHRHIERDIHFKAWLYTIARNRCLSMLRARREQPGEDIELATAGLTDDVQQREDLRELLTDVRKLPDEQREALVLSEVGALSHTEVAQVIGCEVTKVKSLVFQARTALIDRRLARETPCTDIREQLSTLRGGALRRSHLRHHLDACPGCTEYRDQVRRQRQMLALALPVLPSAALRGQVMGALGIGGGTAAAAGGAGVGGGLGLAAKSGLAKIGIATLVAGSAAGGAAVVENGGLPPFSGSSSSLHERGAGTGAGRGGATGSQASGGANGASAQSVSGSGSVRHTSASGGSKAGARSASGSQHGFTPVQGGSNGAMARQFAATRGQGRHTGLTKTRTPTRTRTHHKTATSRPTHVKNTPTPVAKGRTAPRTQPKTQSTPTNTPAPKSQAPADSAPAPAAPDPGTGAGTGKSLRSQGKNVAAPLATG